MNKTDEEMARFERLPKWAQEKINGLKRDLQRANENIVSLNEGPQDSDTFANPYSDLNRKPLGKGTTIGFYVDRQHGERKYFKVEIDKDNEGQFLEIYGSNSFLIEPRSSNVIQIRLNPRF